MSDICDSFGRAASTYDAYAGVQEIVARRLMDRLAPAFDDAGAGKRILEIGAGTGLLTMHLLEKYPKASFLITDLGPDMLNVCQGKVEVWNADHPVEALRSSHIDFRILDGQDISSGLSSAENQGPFDLIASSMTAHWFRDPIAAFKIWQEHLAPGGEIICAMPGKDNFSLWKNHLKECGLDFGGRDDLPDVLPGQAYQDNITIYYKSFRAFCIMLDKTGAGTPKKGYIQPELVDLFNAARGYQEKNNRTFPGDWDIRYGRLLRNSALSSLEYGG